MGTGPTNDDNSSQNGHRKDTSVGVSLASIVLNPELRPDLTYEQIGQILVDVCDVLFLMATQLESKAMRTPTQTPDHLLTIEQAAKQLAVSKDFLYRNAKSLPFAIRLGRSLRFSASGIERYLRQRISKL
jgi:excisionase family DNA binding protein